MSMQVKADALLSAAVGERAVPGVVAGSTTAAGTSYLEAFGEQVLDGGVPMATNSVGWIASMTKAITGAAAMQLVEQGRLSLDAPVSGVIPQLGDVKVLEGFDADGTPKLRAPRAAITLRHLLTHTSGFVYDIWNKSMVQYQEATGTPGIIECRNACLTTPLVFDPGERWDYGIGIDWVGKIIEAVSGKRLGVYLDDNLLGPLGMDDTAFRINDAMRSRLAKIHMRGEDGALEPQMELEIPQDPEFEMGGGGLYGTIPDYLRFIRMILNKGRANGEQLLAPETVDMMSCNQMGALHVRNLKSEIPPFSNDADFFPGLPKSWGLTFMINDEKAPTGRSAGSLAWAGLANSFFWIDPIKGIGGAYLTQILPFVDKKSFPLYLAFEQTVYEGLA